MQKNWKILLLLTMISGAASAESISQKAKELGVDNLDIDVVSKFAALQGQTDRANKFAMSVLFDSQLTLTNDFKFISYAGFKYETGTANSGFNERRYAATSKLVYDYAYISYKPFNFITLEAGAVDNTSDDSVSPLVNYGVSFLGAREKLKIASKYMDVTLVATQAMPYNDDLSDSIGTVNEGTPKFFSEIVNADIKISDTLIKLKAGHFAYQDLSNSVANSDRYFGNTVTGNDESDSEYAYNFKGWLYGASAKFKITNYLTVTPAIDTVKNDEAVEGKNKGRTAKLNIDSEIINHKIKAFFGNFDNESDTAPAFYRKSIQKNSYKGNFVGLTIENPESLKTTIKYVDRTSKSSSLLIKDEKVYSISLRKSYDIF